MRYFILAAALAACCSATRADDGAISPYRPSVSNPAQLPVPGQLELELGGAHGRADTARRDSIPYLLKLAWSEEWGLLWGGEAQVWTRDGNARERGLGDTTLTLKRAFLVSETTAFGAETGVKLPTAKGSIGSGRADYTLNGIYSQDLGSVHMDANFNATRLGDAEPDLARTQTGLSASISAPVAAHWSGNLEWAGTRRGGAPSTAQVLVALVYSPTKRIAIDMGFTKGLNRATQDWVLFSGFVVPLANLW